MYRLTRSKPMLSEYPHIELLDYDFYYESTESRVSRLYLHGFGGDKAQLRAVGSAIEPRTVPALYPSLRAHGASPRPASGYSVLDFAADIHRLADILPGQVDVIGYSYGALVGAASALTWGAELIRSLVVIDQSFRADPAQYVADEWVEGSYLRFTYGYGRMLTALPVPVLFLAARDSAMVAEDERAELLAMSGDRFTLAEIPGDHRGCVRDHPAAIAAAISAFHARISPAKDLT